MTSLVAQMVKNLPAMQEICVQSLGQEDPLEEEMATHSIILAWDNIYGYVDMDIYVYTHIYKNYIFIYVYMEMELYISVYIWNYIYTHTASSLPTHLLVDT